MERKLYVCSCGRKVPILSKGLCPLCRSKQLPKKERKPISSKARVKKSTNYSGFFASCLEELSTIKISEYSGRPIPYPTTCNVCHILPKRIYKSVAEDRGNIIFLTESEHHELDKYLDTMDLDSLENKMPGLYNMVLNRVFLLIQEEKIEERGRLIYEIEEKLKNK